MTDPIVQPNPARPANQPKQNANGEEATASPNRIAHTLTACCRCRTRKTRCDPGLPRCGPCERTNSHCEYYDPTKGTKIPRNYVVHLQHKVRDLEKQLADLERDDAEPDPEDVMRGAAAVRIHESDESKFLGPSSGITITRLVMQLAKQFTDSKTISEIVPDARQKLVKETFNEEDKKPTSKVYPLISHVAAEELPNRDLTNLLVQLFYSKVHPMYPMFHEPSFLQEVDSVYKGSTDPAQNFCLRMVIAISLQKMDKQYAGLADSYYLAALTYLPGAIKPMNLKTLQCFALIAGYSLLTPTRTAVYYIIGLGVRLCQALGIHEEKTITRGHGGVPADPLEVDMRRRLFWCMVTMDLGLAHSLGRPSIFAARKDHIDVNFFELVDDEYITREGLRPAPQASLKKWIAIHFFKMRLLQLEIRRTLYQKKRPEPKDDSHPWFEQMHAKMIAWRDTSPEMDGGSGLNKVWFTGRYNTMVVFLYRPSPQVPRPSLAAATKCFDACRYNVYMHREQVKTGSVDLTWIFTQAIFMVLNTMLWTLSYSEIRRNHARDEVENHLQILMECIELCSERWPGVASAVQLYRNLIAACMKIYDKDGDVPITAGSPSDASVASETINRSRTTSPATTVPFNPPREKAREVPFGYLPAQPVFNISSTQPNNTPSIYQSSPPPLSPPTDSSPALSHHQPHLETPPPPASLPYSQTQNNPQFTPLPTTFSEMTNWNPTFSLPPHEPYSVSMQQPAVTQALSSPIFNEAYAANHGYEMADYLYPQWSNSGRGDEFEMMGLMNQAQQMELMQEFEEREVGRVREMIEQSERIWSPRLG